VLPAEVLVGVAIIVPLVILTVLVAVVGAAEVAVWVVGSTPFLTWAQKLLYHAWRSCLSACNVHSCRHTISDVDVNGVRKAELQKHWS